MEIVSNCCSVNPTSQNDIDADICPKCLEHCLYIECDEGLEDYLYENKKNRRLDDERE